MATNIHEHKDITIPLSIYYYLLREHSEHYKSFHAKLTSGFFRVSTGALA